MGFLAKPQNTETSACIVSKLGYNIDRLLSIKLMRNTGILEVKPNHYFSGF